MSNLSALFGLSTTPANRQYMILKSSTTYTAIMACTIKIIAIGGGGAGARGVTGKNVSGGGAGGTCIKTVQAAANDVLTVTIGVGGTMTSALTSLNGTDGTATTVTGPNSLNMSAGGGKGGVFANYNVTASGGIGGTSSGGDYNLTGGRGGNATFGSDNGTGWLATGGGGVNIGVGAFNGGDQSNGPAYPYATGGGSVFENGGYTYGGGIQFISFTNGTTAITTPSLPFIPVPLLAIFPTIGPYGNNGGNNPPTQLAGNVCGGGPGTNNTVSQSSTAGDGGIFGGGGGAAGAPSAGYNANAGAGGLGGGGGASCGGYNLNAGKGGNGIVILEITS